LAQEISLLDAHQLWASEQPPVFVDIRDGQSFALGHIPGAQPLNNDNVAEFIDQTDADTTVIVVCYHGISSQQAADVLQQHGLNKVLSMQGGFTAWQTQFTTDIETS
jgi:thiosulfate sulfurtransferase